jgi:hypothetical protein
MDKNQVRLKKIPIAVFLKALMDIYESGVDYVDIIGVPGEEQDTIGIAFSDDYMSKAESEDDDDDINNENDSNIEQLEEEIKNIKLSDEDLNQLL